MAEPECVLPLGCSEALKDDLTAPKYQVSDKPTQDRAEVQAPGWKGQLAHSRCFVNTC